MTLPQRVAIILKRCFEVLHPCLYGGLNGGETGDAVTIARDLKKEIAFLVPGADADALVQRFVDALPEVRRLIDTDVTAAYEGDPAATSRMEVVMAYPGLYAITVHRLAHVLYTLKDFRRLCDKEGLEILEVKAESRHLLGKVLLALGFKNLGAARIIARIRRRAS